MTYETLITGLNIFLYFLGSVSFVLAIHSFIKREWEEGINSLFLAVISFVMAYL